MSRGSDDSERTAWFDRGTNLDLRSAYELTAVIRLDLALEPYRERLTPLAQATLSGAWRRAIDKARLPEAAVGAGARNERRRRSSEDRVRPLLSG